MLIIASASGNIFAYAWEDDVPASFDGARWAQALCPKSVGLGLDGLFLLHRPQPGRAWEIEHWEPNGACTFCGNGTRAALAILDPLTEEPLEVRSSGEQVLLQRWKDQVALRLPSGSSFGFRPSPLELTELHACAWIGNPQLIVEVPSVADVDLKTFAPPLRHHPGFPEGTNVIIIERLAPGHARIRSWERGVEGETLSCGTGSAVAGAWLARRTGIRAWNLQPMGTDPVLVDAEILSSGDWGDLWLAGAVRVIGRFVPHETLGL